MRKGMTWIDFHELLHMERLAERVWASMCYAEEVLKGGEHIDFNRLIVEFCDQSEQFGQGTTAELTMDDGENTCLRFITFVNPFLPGIGDDGGRTISDKHVMGITVPEGCPLHTLVEFIALRLSVWAGLKCADGRARTVQFHAESKRGTIVMSLTDDK